VSRRVTFVLPSLHGGGAERAAVILLNGLASRGHEATLFLFRREGVYFDHLDARVRLVVGQGGRVGRVNALRRFLAETPQHAVVSFLSHFSTYAAVRASRSGAKYVISQQTPLSAFLTDEDYHWRRPVQRRVFAAVTRAIYPRADAIAATSQGVATDLMQSFGSPADRIFVVPNPVELDAVEQAAREPIEPQLTVGEGPTLVTAGRLAEVKNLPLLVDALEVLARTTRFRAWILGGGELEGALRSRLARSSIGDRVTLLGFQKNPWKYMARADAFVLTSRYEGFGNVLIEAMASGLPVVATASYGTRDIVEHEVNGLLVEEHRPDAVAAALGRVLTDDSLRRRLAAAGRASAMRFAAPNVVTQFDSLIESVVSTS
jgi:glycosyltransferase involved in cell wall biosynthesis